MKYTCIHEYLQNKRERDNWVPSIKILSNYLPSDQGKENGQNGEKENWSSTKENQTINQIVKNGRSCSNKGYHKSQ